MVDIVPANGTLALQQLQADIQGAEGVRGVLLNIGLTETGNSLAFTGGGEIPDPGKGTTLEIVAGHPARKSGCTLVCFAQIFVQGALKPVAAYRPT
jgi:hypothetical protein